MISSTTRKKAKSEVLLPQAQKYSFPRYLLPFSARGWCSILFAVGLLLLLLLSSSPGRGAAQLIKCWSCSHNRAKQPLIPYLLLFSPPIRSRTIIESKCAARGDVSNNPQAQDVEDGISCAGSATVRAPLRVCVVVKLLCLLHLLV